MGWQVLCWNIVSMCVRVTFISHLQASAHVECIGPFQEVNRPYCMRPRALQNDPGNLFD